MNDTPKIIKGYKVFYSNLTAHAGFQYEIGKSYEMDESPIACQRGFHFCKALKDCFNYFQFDPRNRIAIVEAYGECVDDASGKSATNKIRILKEISWYEALDLLNNGKANTGMNNNGNSNSGDDNDENKNTGNRNFGDNNSGDDNNGNGNTGNKNDGNRNVGDANDGLFNTGNDNRGNKNSGNFNAGNENTGSYNDGHKNVGSENLGSKNSGNKNIGYGNSGSKNKGDYNTGLLNLGNKNTGNDNEGNNNTGNKNIGNHNTGDWNDCDYSTGVFNQTPSNIRMFNKTSRWTLNDWKKSRACSVLISCPTFKHGTSTMSSDFKINKMERTPNADITHTYMFFEKPIASERQKWWNHLPQDDKEAVFSLPNFNPKIFEEITGIDVSRTYKAKKKKKK